jgi:hypothetical protein
VASAIAIAVATAIATATAIAIAVAIAIATATALSAVRSPDVRSWNQAPGTCSAPNGPRVLLRPTCSFRCGSEVAAPR